MKVDFGNAIEKLPIQYKIPISGVYKMTINDKWFYIGGSTNIKTRWKIWRNSIKSGKSKNANIRKLLPEITKVRFEILHHVLDGKDPKLVENKYLQMCFNNPCCLNQCPNSFDNTGLVREKGYVRKYRNPIAVFDKDWNFVSEFEYICDAESKLGVNLERVSDFVNGRCGIVNGYKIKRIASDGSYIEPIPFVPKERPIKPKVIKHKKPITPSKSIIQYDKQGKLIKIHESVGVAARSIGTDKSNFRRQLTTTGNCKGYIFKYA